MKKGFKLIVIASMVCVLFGCTSSKGSDSIKGTYSIHVSGYDWGCGVAKTIVSLDQPLDSVTKDDFVVTETKQATDFTKAPEFPVNEVTVDRKVTNAYLCDEKGNKVDKESKYLALEMYVSPNDGSPLLFTMSTQFNTWSDPYFLTISLAPNAKLTSNKTAVKTVTIDTKYTTKTTDADSMKKDTFKASDGVSYNYAAYQPEQKSDTLVVWLHGLGEGGTDKTDPDVTMLGNKVTALLGDEFQDKMGKVSVLVPQCPTYWMDSDGKKGSFNSGKISATTDSFYTKSLDELIESYKKECGAKKVVLAGCSNGGYMTLVMALANPDKYEAIVPICEAVPDASISDEQLKAIVDMPMYFIYSKDDDVVDPTLHEIPTIQRLKQMGAKNLHVSTTDNVIDTSGQYKDEQGNPHKYSGHWSWIYFDNNESKCDECSVPVWDWMAKQIK